MEQDLEIRRVVPFRSGEGHAVASVTVQVGAVALRARLLEKEGRRWLSMPARKGSDDQWYDWVWFTDRELHKAAESAAIREYDRVMAGPAGWATPPPELEAGLLPG